jgi:hypothetical protein
MLEYLHIDLFTALHVVLLGFVGGVLSGFIGIGGAFFMTPGLMNIGVPGITAVGSALTQRFGKALMGYRSHRDLGHVDRKLGLYMLLAALIGIRAAVWVNTHFYKLSQSKGAEAAAGDLYISVVYIAVLALVSLGMIRDLVHQSHTSGPSTRLAEFVGQYKIPPVVYFPTSDIRLSLWLVLAVGLFTGFLAGAIGAGGFVGVPAMIYVFGVPTVVAAGTQLFLATFMAASGAAAYAFGGFVDLRLAILMLVGSLGGVFLGSFGTKVLKERVMRQVAGLIILICVVSRLIEMPVYLARLDYFHLSAEMILVLRWTSRGVLFSGGVAGMVYVLAAVWRAFRKRKTVQSVLQARHRSDIRASEIKKALNE